MDVGAPALGTTACLPSATSASPSVMAAAPATWRPENRLPNEEEMANSSVKEKGKPGTTGYASLSREVLGTGPMDFSFTCDVAGAADCSCTSLIKLHDLLPVPSQSVSSPAVGGVL